MKKSVLFLLIALMAIVVANAQQISVVSDGTTSLYRTLQDAIEKAPEGSVIYLPGGQFSISDEVKITKKLTVIGIGHYLSTESSEDGFTKIEGNLWFNENSSGSSVMACYITGDVNIGDGGATVNDVVIRYCNLNSVQVKNSECSGTILNQNYIRSESKFGNSAVTIYNNIMSKISNVGAGEILNNISCHYCDGAAAYNQYYRSLDNVNNATIIGNVFRGGRLVYMSYFYSGSNCTFINNFLIGGTIGDAPIIIDANVEEIFEKVNGWSISPASNFHFKNDYIEYETQCGIYAGLGFSDKQLAPVPYIVDHRVDSETDASGKLNIHIRVKASE